MKKSTLLSASDYQVSTQEKTQSVTWKVHEFMKEQQDQIKSVYSELEINGSWHGVPSILYEPIVQGEKCKIAVLAMHSHGNYLSHSIGKGLAERGYRVLCANVSDRDKPLDKKLSDVNVAVSYLRRYPGVEKVILMGHSGGATLMSAYQNVAENGVQALQGNEKLIKCSDVGELTPADGLMLLDSNYGNGAMTLLSLDPAIISEDQGIELNPELNLFNPENGYQPEGSEYSEEFVQKFLKAQGKRNNQLIDIALERLELIECGKGKYADDEPFIIPGGSQMAPNNKLFPQDIRYLSRTKKAWPLLHADGTSTNEIVYSVRKARTGQSFTNSYQMGAVKSTVKTFLNSSAVRTTDAFGYNEDSVYGIDWLSSYSCTPGNIMGVSAPLLVMGMTGSYEFLASEIIYENAKNINDKTIAFVEGATHDFYTAKECEAYPGQFGDTLKTLYDYVDQWLIQPDRFLA